MSCSRYCSGSLSDAYMPVISSAIRVICSLLARSAASPAMLISSAKRASNISSDVNPWRAESILRGLLSSVGESSFSTTNVPAPCFDCKMPTVESERIPARNVGRLTPSNLARSRSGGRRSPGDNSPSWIILRRRSTTSPTVVPFFSELRDVKMPGFDFGMGLFINLILVVKVCRKFSALYLPGCVCAKTLIRIIENFLSVTVR